MLMGKVVGSVVSTRKNENLVGNKFMIVEVADHMRQGAKQIIAIDKIGAGIGEYVLYREVLRESEVVCRKHRSMLQSLELLTKD